LSRGTPGGSLVGTVVVTAIGDTPVMFVSRGKEEESGGLTVSRCVAGKQIGIGPPSRASGVGYAP
jgi:hypothetical protein